MRAVLVSITALLLGVAFLLLGNGMLGTLLGLRLAMAETPTPVTGLVMSAYFAGLLAGSLTAQRVIGVAGHIRSFAAFASIMSAATLIHIIAIDPGSWGILRLVQGYSMAGLFMCIESWLNARADNRTRGGVLSLYMIVVYAALGSGQFLLNAADPAGPVLFALASILLSLAVVPVALTRAPQPELPQPSLLGPRTLLAMSPIGVVGALLSGVMLGAIYGLAPVFAHSIGLDVSNTANFMAALILGGLIMQWPIGRLSDRVDRRMVIGVVGGLVAVASLGIALGGLIYGPVLWPMAVLFGGFAFTLYPLSVAHCNDRIAPEDVVAASGGLLLAYSVGATIGPIIASSAMYLVGGYGLFLTAGLAGLAVAGFTRFRMRLRDPTPEVEKEPFQTVPGTTPVATELDPRVPESPPDAASAAMRDAASESATDDATVRV